VAPRDCVREDLFASWTQPPPPAQAVGELLSCTAHRPGTSDGVIASYEIGREALQSGDPRVALDVWAWSVGFREGSVLELMVGLTLAQQALEVLEQDPAGWQAHIAEVAAASGPLSVAGERRALRVLAATPGIGLRHGLYVRAMEQHTERMEPELQLALQAPEGERQAAVDAVLEAEDGWQTWGPLGLFTEGGRHASWVASSGEVVREAVALDLELQRRARRLTRALARGHDAR